MWRTNVTAGARILPVALAALFVVGVVVPCAGDAPVIVEGEDYPSYGWNNIGGLDIRVESCSGASQGLAASGLDVPGEWIKLRVVLPKTACYDVHVLYQAEYGDTVAFDVKILDAAAPGGVVPVSLGGPGWGFG